MAAPTRTTRTRAKIRPRSVSATGQVPNGGAWQAGAARLLTVDAAAERMSTSPRFIRRLIAERRIEFVKIGRHVRISESVLAEFIEAGRVEPITASDAWRHAGGVA